MATAQAPAPLVRRQRERYFYLSFALIAAAAVLFGFARTYFLKSYFGTPALRPLVHLHGVLFTSWIALFITQTWLVSARRTDIHRRLGVVGGVLAGLMTIVGPWTAITAARLGHVPNPNVPPLVFLVIPIFDIVVFATVIAVALDMRRRPDHHKRLMLVATICILPAAFGRFPIPLLYPYRPHSAFVLMDLVLLSAIAYDTIKHRRLHPAFAWSGALVLISYPLRLAVATTGAWMTFAHWVTR